MDSQLNVLPRSLITKRTSEAMPDDASSNAELPPMLIAKILDAEARGDRIDRQTLLEQHAEYAESLREFFARRDSVTVGEYEGDATPPLKPPIIVDATQTVRNAATGSALHLAQSTTNSLGVIASLFSALSLPLWLTPVVFSILYSYGFSDHQATPEWFFVGLLGSVVSIIAFLCAGFLSLLGLVIGLAGLRDQPRFSARLGILAALAGPMAYLLLVACHHTPNLFCASIRFFWILFQFTIACWIVHRLFVHKCEPTELLRSLALIVVMQLAALIISAAIASRLQFAEAVFHLCVFAVGAHWLAIAFACTREEPAFKQWQRVIIRWGFLLGFVFAVTDALMWHFTGI